MTRGLPFQPGLSSDDETDGTHRKLLDNTQLELRHYCCREGCPHIEGMSQDEPRQLHRQRPVPAQGTASPHAARKFGLPQAGQQLCKIGNPGPTLVSGVLLWQR